MNLLLTGEIQVGKSTLIRRLIKEFDLSVGGFYTSRHFIHGKQDGFIIKDINDDNEEAGYPLHYIAKGSRETGWQPIPEAFETVGVQILTNCLHAKSDLIIMDELGHFESGAPLFQELVHQCLSAPAPVLGVIKPRYTRFLDSIRRREDVQIITITPINREHQYLHLKALLQTLLKR